MQNEHVVTENRSYLLVDQICATNNPIWRNENYWTILSDRSEEKDYYSFLSNRSDWYPRFRKPIIRFGVMKAFGHFCPKVRKRGSKDYSSFLTI
jgi:hypothetical protein